MDGIKHLEEILVNYKQGKSLKSIGFNYPCIASFRKNKKIWYCNLKGNDTIKNFYYDEELEPDDIEDYKKTQPYMIFSVGKKDMVTECDNFTAPLKDQVITWFMKELDIFGFVDPVIDFSCYTARIVNNKTSNLIYSSGEIIEYEEARTHLIDQLIELGKKLI